MKLTITTNRFTASIRIRAHSVGIKVSPTPDNIDEVLDKLLIHPKLTGLINRPISFIYIEEYPTYTIIQLDHKHPISSIYINEYNLNLSLSDNLIIQGPSTIIKDIARAEKTIFELISNQKPKTPPKSKISGFIHTINTDTPKQFFFSAEKLYLDIDSSWKKRLPFKFRTIVSKNMKNIVHLTETNQFNIIYLPIHKFTTKHYYISETVQNAGDRIVFLLPTNRLKIIHL